MREQLELRLEGLRDVFLNFKGKWLEKGHLDRRERRKLRLEESKDQQHFKTNFI